ncbi:HNH endonuclease [Paenibacillus mendelii]|uniref:HNH endonuclease n=1 Tax=Paenibacillus mendelii TaxID=206163 RepID=A0ABV6JIY0_9BACL|nr:HNH endonuclease signature motif containing protein [Paenibacillus mendelii]MCQ6558790.1 HNH endonuclease [Paenibacillus mendelii]
MDVKLCGGCSEEKPLSSFTKRSGRNGRRGTCRSCQRRRHRENSHPTAGEDGESTEAGARTAGPERSTDLPVPVHNDTTAAEAESDAPQRKRKRRSRKKRKQAGDGQGQERQTASLDETEDQPDSSPVVLEEEVDSQPVTLNEAPTKRKRKRKRRRRGRPLEEKDEKTLHTSGFEHGHALEPAEPEPIELNEFTAAELPVKTEGERGERSDHRNEAITDESVPRRKRKRKRRRKRRSLDSHVPGEEERPPVRPPYKRIVPIKGSFSYDTRLLNDRGTGLIRLRGRRETGKRWSTEIPTEMAVRMVNEGAAGIINPTLIHKLYTKTDFRLYILQRDDYVCKYCGRFGDTIDHVMPKSKGGLSTPDNCVCACAECNLKKADHLDFVFDDL